MRGNLLAKRWNLPGAQANVFVWGGLGRATGNDFAGSTLARNAGFQPDYETRRVYAAFRSDLQESDHFSHRIDTLQLGWAPYEHDYDTLATWFVVQGRRYTGGCTTAPKPRCWCASSRAAPGSRPAPPPTASSRPWPCSTSE